MSEKNKKQDESQDNNQISFDDHLERATNIVQSWPKWKQNIIGAATPELRKQYLKQLENTEFEKFVKKLQDIKHAKKDLKCFSGNDADLQYWYECTKCGCIVIIDYSAPESMELWSCPVCNNLKDFPHRYFSKKEIDECPAIKQLIDIHKEVGFP